MLIKYQKLLTNRNCLNFLMFLHRVKGDRQNPEPRVAVRLSVRTEGICCEAIMIKGDYVRNDIYAKRRNFEVNIETNQW